jgi:hypothetical protein
MNSSSVNIHYHRITVSPTCHQDEIIKTLINPGETFEYSVHFPQHAPPGLYWYHPHVHSISEHQTQGGGTGAIVVMGIHNVEPAVSGLPEKVLIIRDQQVPGSPMPTGNIPSWDVTLNFVSITSPTTPNSNDWVPAIIPMHTGDEEFWRISNSSADTIIDFEYLFDGVPQLMKLVEIDGVAVNSQDGIQPGTLVPVTHFVLPTAARVSGRCGSLSPNDPVSTFRVISCAILTEGGGVATISWDRAGTRQSGHGQSRSPVHDVK